MSLLSLMYQLHRVRDQIREAETAPRDGCPPRRPAGALLRSHADQWAEAHLPASPRRQVILRPLAEVRETSTGSVHRLLPRLRALIEEWTEQEGITPAPPLPGAGDLVQELDGEGLLDFRRLLETECGAGGSVRVCCSGDCGRAAA
jgi:hypothetical protein